MYDNTIRKLNKFIRICKWRSLTIYFVKSVIDSIQKNDGINISILLDIYIEKTMFIPDVFPQKKLNRDEGIKLEKAFWQVILTSSDNDNDLVLFDFVKLYFRMCTNITDHVPIRYWDYYNDGNEEEQWGYGYKDDMIAQFKQDIYNKNNTLQDQGKDNSIDTLENRIKFWINIITNDQGPVPDNLYDYDYNNEGLDYSVSGWEIFPEIGELKKLLDILRSK